MNSVHTGKVRNLTAFGAFVELEEGVDGLVHISDLSWTKKVRHPGEVVKKGDEIKVKILDINRDERRIALGHKQVDPNPWDHFEDMYKVGSVTEGTVARMIDKGIIVTLELGVDGFVPLNHLGEKGAKKPVEMPNAGDILKLKVIEFDKENKRIVLSAKAVKDAEERAEIEGYKPDDSKTTIGDVASVELKEEKAEAELATEAKEEKKTAAKKTAKVKAEDKTEEKTEAKEEKKTTAKKTPAKKTTKAKTEDKAEEKEEKKSPAKKKAPAKKTTAKKKED
jgi:small subunit ribosomal protein S1